MQEMSETMKEKSKNRLISIRRSQVIEYSSKGFNNAMIARALHISEPTVSRDMAFLKTQAQRDISKLVDERLPLEFSKCLTGLDYILQQSFYICSKDETDTKERIAALNLAKETYSAKLELLTNSTTINNALKFIEEHKQNQKTNNNNQNNYNNLDNNNNDSKQEREQEVYEHQNQEQHKDQDKEEVIVTSTEETTEEEVF